MKINFKSGNPSPTVYYIGVENKDISKDIIDRLFRATSYACFATMSRMNHKTFLVGYDDLTKTYADNKKYTELYLGDLEEHLFSLYPGTLERIENTWGIRPNSILYLVTPSKCPGVLLLGFLNAIKVISESPITPVTYWIIKEKYREVLFYQRLLLCHVTYDVETGVKPTWFSGGNHCIIDVVKLKHVKGLNLKSIKNWWEKCEVKRTIGRKWGGSSNDKFIPKENTAEYDGWQPTTKLFKEPQPLTDELIKECT